MDVKKTLDTCSKFNTNMTWQYTCPTSEPALLSYSMLSLVECLHTSNLGKERASGFSYFHGLLLHHSGRSQVHLNPNLSFLNFTQKVKPKEAKIKC